MRKIEISDKLYKQIEGFCEINGLKVSEFCEEKLNDAIMIEQYGDTPFTDYHENKQFEESSKDAEEQNVSSSATTEEIKWPEAITKPNYDLTVPADIVTELPKEDLEPKGDFVYVDFVQPTPPVKKVTKKRRLK